MRRHLVAALVVCVLAQGLVAPALAQATTTQPIEDDAPYYDDENGSTNMTDWVPDDGNATADGILEMIARIPGIFIGSGDMDPSGSGYEGLLLTGVIIGGAALMSIRGTGVGPVGGSMIGMVLAYGLTSIGMLPVWIQPLLLFTLVGVPASAAIIRVFRG